MTLDAFVSAGWQDHAEDAEGVFRRFPDGLALATQPAHVPPLAGLIAHVAGEHLGRYDDGVRLLDALVARPGFDPATPEVKAAIRMQAVLHLAAGRRLASDAAEAASRVPTSPVASGRVRILAVAAAALAGRRETARAGALLDEALALAADYHPTATDPATRALAVTGNNLAQALEMRTDRTPAEDALMVRAAEVGLRFWSMAGTWLETERAHYRLAQSLRKAGRAAAALAQARVGLGIVAANGGDPFEAFYQHEVAALAHAALGDRSAARAARDTAAACLPALTDPDARAMATTSLAELDDALAR